MSSPNGDDLVLSARDITVELTSWRGTGRPVDGISFDLRRGETLGLVGESGCGKSMTALALVGLLPKPAARIVGGQLLFKGEDLLAKSPEELRHYRGRSLAMILQDPLAALNPVFTIGHQLYEPLRLHKGLRGKPLVKRAIDLLRLMRIPAASDRLGSYPHQFSGGMRQRVVGAIALSGDPEVIVADEPTTSLDVTIQAAYLDLLRDVQERTGLGMVFITHDFGIVGQLCHTVAVMYAGRLVERAPTRHIFEQPAHPYTKALLRSVPDLETDITRLASIPGSPPTVFEPPTGCRFHPRCWLYERLGRPARCRDDVPNLVPVSAEQDVACHFSSEAVAMEVEVAVPMPSRSDAS